MTKIEYADETWNPFAGCSPCSEGCDNCYAARAACGRWLKQHSLYKGLAVNNKWTGEVRLCTDIGREDILDKPLHWKEPRTIFVGNMGDLFHKKVPLEFVNKVALVMARCPQHTFLVLTKRPEIALEHTRNWQKQSGYPALFSDNVYLGVTICNRPERKKAEILRLIPAARKWWSVEPLLEHLGELDLRGVDQVVLGCESGPNRRPCKIEWMIDIVNQCKAAGVKVFVKQVNINGKVSHDKGKVSHDKDEWPEELRIRERI